MSISVKKQKISHKDAKRLKFAYLIAVALIMYAVLPKLSLFRGSMGSVEQINFTYVLLAALSVGGTYFAGAFNYMFLKFKPINYGQTVIVQLAATFANRILPAGIGNIGVNYDYLTHKKHSKSQAAAVVAMNNTLGFIGHGIIVATVLIIWPSYLSKIHIDEPSHNSILAAISLTLICLLVFQSKLRSKIIGGILAFKEQILNYVTRPANLLIALFGSIALTMFNLLGFWFCIWAFGVHLLLGEAFIVFTFGVAAATAVPTPGGLGGAEAGFTAGLLAFGLPSGQALAIVLLYRLIYFWLALIAGSIALAVARKKHYL